ncbi:MAG: HisA/HisF-related TIM barrel protein [Spirochaetales bacterium]
MLILPAIDLLGGQCVRLHQGDYGQVETYGLDPVAVAREFAAAGAKRLHIVDLDAARGGTTAAGSSINRPVIRRLCEAFDGVVEVGGGVRTADDVAELLDAGADRLIVGTLLVRDPDAVAGWVARFGAKFIGGIDARGGEVKVSGWEQGSKLLDTDLAARCRELGLISLVYTNIDRDGTLSGPDLERTLLVAEAAGLPVILSGGVSSLADFEAISQAAHPLLVGVITGKALYKNRINLADVIGRYQTPDTGGLW